MRRSRLLSLVAFSFTFGCRAAAPKPEPESSVATQRAAASVRDLAQIRREGNHLVSSGSAYLRAHSHNPVDWYPWGPEALALAVKLDRPIFLSIGYVSCHWCHVMEHEVFERDDAAAYLNEHFISIKVDREERPDLDAAYMAAVQAMTGSGGWPMTALLTPSLRPFFGGTYFPHDQFMAMIRAGFARFKDERNAAENDGANVYARIAASTPKTPSAALTESELQGLARQALEQVDPVHGGFRGRAKFPTPIKWRFLLDAFRKSGDETLARAIRQTLDAMAEGGVRDQIGGGFFRYSTEPTWTVPHFEKMLYDNAQLAELYLEAAATFDEPRYRAIALDTLDFMLRDTTTGEHGFGASFDADADGKEGSTYLWRPSELSAVLGEADGTRVATLLGVTESGNFEGSNVPTLRAPAHDLTLWQSARPKLLARRTQRAQPNFDAKLVSAWNGLAIGALALGYRASRDARYLTAAEAAADAIWRLNRTTSDELTRASNSGKGEGAAVLDDYAFLAQGLIALGESTGKSQYLEHALSLVTTALARFGADSGGFFLTASATQEPLGRRVETYDGVEPSGNAALLSALQKLAALTGRDDLNDSVHRALEHYAGEMRRSGIDMAGWLDVALLDAGPYYELVIAGDDAALPNIWHSLLPAWTVGVRVSGSGPTPELERLLPTTSGKRARAGAALAYVCVHGSCQQPTGDAAVLRRELLHGWAK